MRRSSNIEIWEPKPAASRRAYSTGYEPPFDRFSGAELGIGLAKVGDRRDDAGLERLDRHDVFEPDTHRVTGEALGVGDDHAVGVGAEHPPQREDLGRRASAPCRGVGLVRHEHRRRSDLHGGRCRCVLRRRRPAAPSRRRCGRRRAGCRGRRCWRSRSPSTSQMGCKPRSRAASAASTTMAAAPMPRIIPWRRRSNGKRGLGDVVVGGRRSASRGSRSRTIRGARRR